MSEQFPPLDGGTSSVSEQKSLKQMMGTESFREYIANIRRGLKQPKDSGEYKYAIHQVVRVWSPIASVVLPILMVIAVMLAPSPPPAPASEFEVTMMDNTAIEELEDIQEIVPEKPPEEEFKPPDIENFDPSTVPDEALVGGPVGPSVGPGASSADSSAEFSPQPAAFDSVSMIKSPIKMTGIFGSRTPGARGQALGQYGGGGAGGAATEYSVYLALRWLKKYQEPTGSWSTSGGGGDNQYGGARPAMTGLALLTYLAHGETPASDEFGGTVERAIKWLTENQEENGDFKGSDEHNYSQAIATYALCEAFALTRIPMVKTAAEKGLTRIIKGQNPEGMLWNYNYEPRNMDSRVMDKDRDDLSFAGWCMQALKAGSSAGLEVEGLEEAKRRAVQGVKLNGKDFGDGTRAFGYTRQNDPWEITSAGTLCLQLLGAGKSKEVAEAILWLKRANCDWANPWSENPIYHWYYITQVKFHAGGSVWNDWNKQFSPQLVKNQVVIKGAIADTKGAMVDIGYWKPANPPHVTGKDKDGKDTTQKEHCQSYVYNTTLCALMLQVYYRYLPTYKPVESAEEGPASLSDESQDVDIQIL